MCQPYLIQEVRRCQWDSYGNTAQFVGSVGDAFSAICCLQIFRFTSSKPSKSAIASDEKFIRLRTNSFVRYCLTFFGKFSNTSSGRSGEVYKNVSFAALYCTLTQVAVLTRLTLPEVQQLQKARN